VRNLTYDRYWAQQKNVEPIGFPAGIKMQGGEGTIDDLVRSTDRGILVTRFWYIRSLDPRPRARRHLPDRERQDQSFGRHRRRHRGAADQEARLQLPIHQRRGVTRAAFP
jgi:hypothetical protein